MDTYDTKESELVEYHFTSYIADVFSSGVYNGVLALDPFVPLMLGLLKYSLKVATN